MEIFEKILTPILNAYFNEKIESIEKVIIDKERIGTVNNMEIRIYPNDHNPPHFHVISRDKKVNAKFKIENCNYISGEISGKEKRRIKSFYNDPKTIIVMTKVWNKYQNNN
ncbi:DUF4160 domain-containing protein [Aquimarina algiphila]|uniref:DUF4160 domain-containing protein n=1 Tax=Aquimarina algiphila TaxID=2047982 RepID=A0A554VBJ2_9FLAO|nr:DUF4160 domain-containing protein [Aquimarina algiphila]TSE03931.1 DUF4160 domain-containing protein [Aquimarina algiphila]